MRTIDLGFTTIDLGSNTKSVTGVSYNGAILNRRLWRVTESVDPNSNLERVLNDFNGGDLITEIRESLGQSVG